MKLHPLALNRSRRAANEQLDRLLAEAPAEPINAASRWVIFSDLHMGDGGPQDNFRRNAGMFRRVLISYYLNQRFGIVLNGDIEELQLFSLQEIVARWRDIYDVFRMFEIGPGLIKLSGNHDVERPSARPVPGTFPVREAIRLAYGPDSLLVFHGHQVRPFNDLATRLTPWVLRFIARPLGIKNKSTSADSRKRFRVERMVYEFARSRGLAAVIGHTHRPLFESLSKLDTLRFKIERACRQLAERPNGKRGALEARIRAYSEEMDRMLARNDRADHSGSLYQAVPLVPCLFNSGCAIGKSGMTAIEVSGGCIRLVHWFDGGRAHRYLEKNGYRPEPLAGTPYYRLVLKEETLDYVFALIRLMRPAAVPSASSTDKPGRPKLAGPITSRAVAPHPACGPSG
jgi:UDP-2,3-diacylglucosamine pyrophosphatase LpxH